MYQKLYFINLATLKLKTSSMSVAVCYIIMSSPVWKEGLRVAEY